MTSVQLTSDDIQLRKQRRNDMLKAFGLPKYDKFIKQDNEFPEICPACEGQKQDWNSKSKMMEDCPTCKGMGKI